MSDLSSLPEQYRLIMQKAVRSLHTAQKIFEDGDYDFASSRAYYAAFYAIEAVLLTKSLSFSKHSGVIGAFNRHFIKTLLFPGEFSKMMSRLFRERQIGDYDFGASITEQDAQEDLASAEVIVHAISKYLLDLMPEGEPEELPINLSN